MTTAYSNETRGVLRPLSDRPAATSLGGTPEEAIIHGTIDTRRSEPTVTELIRIAVLLGTLALASCSTSDPTESALPPETTSSTTTTTPPQLPPTSAATDTGNTLHVPASAHPDIDGVLKTSEWEDSTTVTMTDGSSLHWLHNGNVLYVALESSAVGAVNLAIATDEEAWILHSSAALGSALYLPGDGLWEVSHTFAWCCRSATDDSARLQLLNEEGWQANIGFAGDGGIVEYQVALPWDGAAVAVSYLTDSETSAVWPASLSSEARDQLVGPWPRERTFNLDEWHTLVRTDA